MILGLSGKARSGKDTVANYILENPSNNFVKYAFADPLKKAASEMFGIPLNYFHDDVLKEEVIPFWGLSPRQIAQKLGTEGGRELFMQDLWIKRAELVYEDANELSHHLLMSDVRFENEATFVRERGRVVHVIRPGADGKVGDEGHASEAGIEILDDDIVIYNNKDFNHLFSQVDKMLKVIYD